MTPDELKAEIANHSGVLLYERRTTPTPGSRTAYYVWANVPEPRNGKTYFVCFTLDAGGKVGRSIVDSTPAVLTDASRAAHERNPEYTML